MMKSVRGKKRGSVVLHDWYLADPPLFTDHIEPVGMWFDRFGPEKGRIHIRGLGLRLPDGRWKLHHSRARAKRDYQSISRTADTRYTWAENIEQLVRQRMKKFKPRYIKASTISENVHSSYLYPGRRGEWVEPDPFRVIVGTEDGNLRDPFSYELCDYFQKVADSIAFDPWYQDAGWESINPGVQYFWVKPKMIA